MLECLPTCTACTYCAEQYNGRILVARESAAAPGKASTRSTFSNADDQPIDNPTGEFDYPASSWLV